MDIRVKFTHEACLVGAHVQKHRWRFITAIVRLDYNGSRRYSTQVHCTPRYRVVTRDKSGQLVTSEHDGIGSGASDKVRSKRPKDPSGAFTPSC